MFMRNLKKWKKPKTEHGHLALQKSKVMVSNELAANMLKVRYIEVIGCNHSCCRKLLRRSQSNG